MQLIPNWMRGYYVLRSTDDLTEYILQLKCLYYIQVIVVDASWNLLGIKLLSKNYNSTRETIIYDINKCYAVQTKSG